MEIRTYIGRKLNYVNGILRRQIELDRHLKQRENLKLTYSYYVRPKNPIDFLTKRYILYPLLMKYRQKDEEKKDVIYHITSQFLGVLVNFSNKDKTITTCHDIFSFIEKNNPKNPPFIQKYGLMGLKKSTIIISISQFTKTELISKFGIDEKKITVIKNGINRKMFRKISSEETSRIVPLFPRYNKLLYVGTEVPRKGFPILLKALYRVKKELKKVKLIRIGNCEHREMIRNLGLEDDIIYLKDISNKRLVEIYNVSDLFVFPSLYEGWGAPGLEAASCGTLVICSDIPIFREVYQDFPVYFPVKNDKKLAEKILYYLKNKSLTEEKGLKGIELAEKYSWQDSSREYLNLLNNILDRF